MLTLTLLNEAATEALGRQIAALAQASDLILLRGDLGMGKTSLARAFLQARAAEPIEVPSPTFTLIESYDLTPPVHHVDLYRLDGPEQIVELGLDDLYDDGIVLIEWPERAEGMLPMDALQIELRDEGAGRREATLTAIGHAWAERLENLRKAEAI